MKKTILFAVIILSNLFVSAQKGKLVSAINYLQNGELIQAKALIDTVCVNEKTKDLSKTWFVKGKIYQAIYESQKPELISLTTDPLKVVYSSYIKAIDIDKENYNEDMTPYLKNLKIDFLNKGILAFNAQKYDDALESFEYSLKIDKLPAINILDTAIYYNAAISAHYAKNYDKAIEFYDVTIKNNYKKLNSYIFKSEIYLTLKDSANYFSTLKEGISYFPDNEKLVINLVNYYLNTNNSELALNYINKLIEKTPGNATYYFAQGTLYDKMEKQDLAQIAYEKAINLKPDYFDAYYNLGALYYNKAAKVLELAINIPLKEQAKYEAEQGKAKNLFKTSLPYFEKAYNLNKKDVNTMQTLSIIYTKLKMEDKAKEINDILNKK